MGKLPRTIWQYNKPDDEVVDNLAEQFNLPSFVSAVLVQRELTDIDIASKFLNPTLNQLHDPFMLEGMEKAIMRIRKSLIDQEKILVCGDYDVDGITSVALLKRCLPVLGAETFTYLPNRLADGYGFHQISVDKARELGAKLMITVDCGITARDAVEYAKTYDIDVIITDHHEPNGPLPDAHAILNPKCENSTYPDKNLAGIGVAFKLVQALLKEDILQYPLPSLLELVALGTVADVANLTGENRILVHFGLEALAHTSHPGLKALMKICGIIHGRSLDPFAIGYQLGPRINAVGRLGSPEEALNLLLTLSSDDARSLASNMNYINQKRQSIEEQILRSVELNLSELDIESEPFIVISGEDWHEGVIGIVASKITDRFYRPACVISIKNGVGKGSGRSIPSFSLFDCLNAVRDTVIEFGGHQIAVGFRIDPANIKDFAKRCNDIAKEKLLADDLIPKTTVDAEMDIDDLNFRSIKSLDRLSPFGLGNPKPRFLIRKLRLRYPTRSVGSDGAHLKLVLTNGKMTVDAIAFGFGDQKNLINRSKELSIIATPEINVWNGRESIQLHIHDINPFL